MIRRCQGLGVPEVRLFAGELCPLQCRIRSPEPGCGGQVLAVFVELHQGGGVFGGPFLLGAIELATFELLSVPVAIAILRRFALQKQGQGVMRFGMFLGCQLLQRVDQEGRVEIEVQSVLPRGGVVDASVVWHLFVVDIPPVCIACDQLHQVFDIDGDQPVSLSQRGDGLDDALALRGGIAQGQAALGKPGHVIFGELPRLSYLTDDGVSCERRMGVEAQQRGEQFVEVGATDGDPVLVVKLGLCVEAQLFDAHGSNSSSEPRRVGLCAHV